MKLSATSRHPSQYLRDMIVEAAGFVYEDDAWTITHGKVVVEVEKELKSIPRYLSVFVNHSPHSYSIIKATLILAEYDTLTYTLEHEYLKTGR